MCLLAFGGFNLGRSMFIIKHASKILICAYITLQPIHR